LVWSRDTYAITIHKAQGVSVDRAILKISGKQDFAPGLTYVAISRVQSLCGLFFEEPSGYQRLKSKPSEMVAMRNTDYIRRAAQEIPLLEAAPRTTRQFGGPGPASALSNYGSDLPDFVDDGAMPPPSTRGCASQIEIPILRSDPVQSAITIPTGTSVPFTSDHNMSDNLMSNNVNHGQNEKIGGIQGSYS
jgi:hypothetical protein